MLKMFFAKVLRNQKGFTLLEMIVVVGIISLLAAAIIPNVGRFIGTGSEGAKLAEEDSVRLAMNAMMSEVVITTVDPWDLSGAKSATNVWTDKPTDPSGGAVPLGDPAQQYLMAPTTLFYYCYDFRGIITQVFESEVSCP